MTPGAEITGPGHGRTLSWRSRNSSESNWWTSALELSSTLASKMDQVGIFFNNLYVKVNITKYVARLIHTIPSSQYDCREGQSILG